MGILRCCDKQQTGRSAHAQFTGAGQNRRPETWEPDGGGGPLFGDSRAALATPRSSRFSGLNCIGRATSAPNQTVPRGCRLNRPGAGLRPGEARPPGSTHREFLRAPTMEPNILLCTVGIESFFFLQKKSYGVGGPALQMAFTNNPGGGVSWCKARTGFWWVVYPV